MSFFTIVNVVVYAVLLLIQSPCIQAANTGAPAQPPANIDEWTGWGGNVYNNRWNAKNTKLNSTNVGKLVQNCKLTYPIGVVATPVVLNYTAYYPTSNGSFYALNIATCEYDWSVNVTKLIYDFATPSAFVLNYSLPISRTSPQIDGNNLYFGTQALALLIAVDLKTGQHLGTVQVNNHPTAIITQSPTVYDGKIYSGTSSHEDAASKDKTYKCCSFIGNFASYTFDRTAKKFNKVWEVKSLPENQGWAGAGIWGPQPSIDPVRKQVFIGTGNLLVYPDAYKKCANESATCLPDGVWQDSVVALDMATGKVNWRQTITPLDGWLAACGYPGAPTSESSLCPAGVGADADFGMAPTFVPAALGDGTTGNDSVVVGQKSGNIFNINAVTGVIQWNTAVGGDATGSWLSWGVAVDAAKVYFTSINYGLKEYQLRPSGQTIKNSAWGALSLKRGIQIWEQQVPDNQLAYSPPGLVNDLVLVGQTGGSTEKVSGKMLALAKDSGDVLNTIPLEGVQNTGIVAKGGFLLMGTGYAYRNPFDFGNFYVYALPGAIADAVSEMAAAAQAAKTKPSASATSSAASSEPTTKKNSAAQLGGNRLMNVIYPLAVLAAVYCWFG